MTMPINRYRTSVGLRRAFASSSANTVVNRVRSIYIRIIVAFEIASPLNAYSAQTNSDFFQLFSPSKISMPSAYNAAMVPPNSAKFRPRPVHFVKLPGNSEQTVCNKK